MAEKIDRETTVRRLQLASQFQNDPQREKLFHDVPDGCVIGFSPRNRQFLSSVAHQVRDRRFITARQFEVVERLLAEPAMAYQFSFGTQLPALPADFRWVNFEDYQPKVVTVNEMGTKEPDLRDAGDAPALTVGKRTLNFSAQQEQPMGKLYVELDELVFKPYKYPTTNIKKAGKFRWDGDTKTWRHRGVHAEVVTRLFSVWSEIEVDESVDIALAAAKELIELPESIKDHKTAFEFQKDAIQFILSHPKALLALAPGLGKSATTILAAMELLEQGTITTIGIIAPHTLMKTWQNEISKWADDWSCILHRDFKDQPMDASWLICNYASLSRGRLPAEMEDCDLVIFDESILLKSHGRKREKDKTKGTSRWVFKTNRVQQAFEIAQGVDWCWLLSGGPTSKYVDDLWSQFHILDSQRFSSYWKFAEEYCLIENTPWAKQVTGNKPGAIERIQEDYADIMFARSQDQVLDLPDWIMEDIEVPMSRKQEIAYEEMNKDWTTTLEIAGGEVELTAPNVLSQVVRLTQIASNPILFGKGITAISPKWQAAIDLLEVRQGPFIIWTRFIETAKRMEHHIQRKGYTVATLIGETPVAIRADAVKAFQNGHVDVLIAHPKVGKFGLTLTEARTAIYLENSYDGDDYYQSLHRVRRIGTKYSPLVIRLKSIYQDGRPTVDHLIADVLDAKAETTFKVTTAKLISILEGGGTL